MRTTIAAGYGALVFFAVIGAGMPARAGDTSIPQTVSATAPIAAGAPINFIAHRAVYDLQLDNRKQSTSVDSMRGRIVYDFSGNE